MKQNNNNDMYPSDPKLSLWTSWPIFMVILIKAMLLGVLPVVYWLVSYVGNNVKQYWPSRFCYEKPLGQRFVL
jgi:hypothetical protein